MRRLSLPLALMTFAAMTFGLAATLAQSAGLSLAQVVTTALSANAEVQNAQSAAAQAKVTRAARDADPTALVTDQLQGRQAAELLGVQANAVRLLVMSDAVGEFLNLSENGDAVEYLTNQVRLSEQGLAIAKARLSSRTATPVDVQRSETE